MPKRKHLKKIHTAPRTDANQGVKAHIERVRKQNEYIIRKIAEYKAKQEEMRRMMEEQQNAAPMVDGLGDSDRDIANE